MTPFPEGHREVSQQRASRPKRSARRAFLTGRPPGLSTASEVLFLHGLPPRRLVVARGPPAKRVAPPPQLRRVTTSAMALYSSASASRAFASARSRAA
eukprot:6345189-Pyramimonas_sp.AAC.1